MMKIELQLPSGLRITFEGDEEAFDRFTGFLNEPPGFVENLGSGGALEAGTSLPALEESTDGGSSGPTDDPLSARALHERLREVGATTDMERVTVIAQAALEAGREAIDYSTVDTLYVELGLPKPARWAKTFANAKSRNLVRSVGQGLWRPTVVGENFARFGTREGTRTRTRRERLGLPPAEEESS